MTIINAESLFAAMDREFTSVVNDRPYTVHGHKIPLSSVLRIFEYGVQRVINDRCGGSDKTAEQKHELAQSMVRRIIDGELGVRSNAAAGVDPFVSFMRREMLSYFNKTQKKALAEMDSDARIAAIDAAFAKNETKLRPAIESAWEMAKARKSDAANVAATLDLSF